MIGTASASDYEAYGYDANDNRTSLRKRDGRTIGYTYDALNRVTVKDIPGGTAADVYYGYDLRGLQTYARFASSSGAGIATVYDGFGRPVTSTTDQGGTTRTLSFQYDADGNRTRITHPDGVYFAYSYDGLDRMLHADWWAPASGTVPFMQLTYDAQGRRSDINRASSFTGYAYDSIGRPSGMNQRFAGNAGNVTTAFGYNPSGQIIVRSRDNDDYAFGGYVSVSRACATNGLNQYTSAGPATFGYDANGNLIGDGSRSFGYDVENRLVSSGAVTLAYDPLGRLWQTSGGTSGTTQFLYDGDALVAEYDGDTGALRRRYMHGPGVDETILWDEGAGMNCSGTRFLHTDHQGSVVAVADCSGNRIAVDTYDEYGIPGSGNIGRFQYTGQAWLPELGLYYYKARIYSPTLGRFLQTDPIGYDDQNNLYAYVGNDPINRRDPTGTQCTGSRIDCDGGIAPGFSGSTAGATSNKNGVKNPSGDQNGATVFVNDPNGRHRTNRIGALAECAIHQGGCSRTVAGTPDGKILYRAGRFKVRDRDVQTDPRTGKLLPGGGVSVNTNPNALKGMHTFGIPPAGVGIIRDGGTHYLLVPNRPMEREEFDALIESMNTSR